MPGKRARSAVGHLDAVARGVRKRRQPGDEGDSGIALICRQPRAVRQLSDEEQEAIIELLPTNYGIRGANRKRRKEHPDEPAGATIQAALVESWNSGLRDVVQAELRDAGTEVAKKPGERAASRRIAPTPIGPSAANAARQQIFLHPTICHLNSRNKRHWEGDDPA